MVVLRLVYLDVKPAMGFIYEGVDVVFSRQVYRINCNIVLFKVRMSNPQGTILLKKFCYKIHQV